MALIPCHECGKNVSLKAPTCLHDGEGLIAKMQTKSMVSYFLAIMMLGACSEPESEVEAPPIVLSDPCPQGYHCTVNDQGQPQCDEGYEREDPNSSTSFRCVPIPPQGLAEGTLGGSCYGNGTCNQGLVCADQTCMELGPPELEVTCISAIQTMFSDRVYLSARIKNSGEQGQFQIRLTQRGCGPADPERHLADAGPYTAPSQSERLYEADFPVNCRGLFNAILELQTDQGWAEVRRFENIHEGDDCSAP